jgi:hypothetical protein
LLDFEIGARILVSSGGHYGMKWSVLLYYIITLLLME